MVEQGRIDESPIFSSAGSILPLGGIIMTEVFRVLALSMFEAMNLRTSTASCSKPLTASSESRCTTKGVEQIQFIAILHWNSALAHMSPSGPDAMCSTSVEETQGLGKMSNSHPDEVSPDEKRRTCLF
eukprot:snap_masked-scaffold17_size721972-processed-gene-3.3 protein:Tk09966 transcript:snap_masked-scaffold17_size721972-processed-gene-3.3-mRNA-1 annotation:"glycoside hydrolase family protein"